LDYDLGQSVVLEYYTLKNDGALSKQPSSGQS
jgi:hypothetical protein